MPTDVSDKPGTVPLAWVGWELVMPDEWRPLRIEGSWDSGSLVVGGTADPVAQIKWLRPRRRSFDAERWIRRRLRSRRLEPGRPPGAAPRGFAEGAWVPDENSRQLLRSWYGYSREAGLLIEVVANAETDRSSRRELARLVVPSLRTSAKDAPTRWSVFGSSFETPAGYVLARRRVGLGDVTIDLAGPNRSRLVLRQVYPGELALKRRKLARWLEVRPFKEKRRYRSKDEPAECVIETDGRELRGLRITGWKRLPFPLGFIAPRRSTAAAVVDAELDRVLVAEYDAPDEADPAVVDRALARMNWAMRPGDRG
jgi:hypothetical protein